MKKNPTEKGTRTIVPRTFIWKHTQGEEMIIATNTAEARQRRQEIAAEKHLHWKRDSVDFYEVKL